MIGPWTDVKISDGAVTAISMVERKTIRSKRNTKNGHLIARQPNLAVIQH